MEPWFWRACWQFWRFAWPVRLRQQMELQRPELRSRFSPPVLPDFLEMFGVPVYVAQCFMTMCVSALALTSLDAVARIGRMSFQELFSVDDMEHAEGWRKLLCNKYFSTVITLACGYILTQNRLFQYLAAVWKRKPASERSGTDYTLRLLKGNRA